MKKPDPLTRREREIMDILHRRGRATAHEVMDDLADPPSYSAVRTFLRLLEERGHVRHEQDGPRYVYTPTVARREAQRSAIAHLVDTFFDGSVENAVATLVESSKPKLSAQELDRIAALVAKAKKEGR
ncbi:MAG: BlaI/MecI/CopY family transcriptional regulator [Deltaproteobacteria bacterium]|nr:MAG: BlaI/MecI/CopY family transcriptional regulator [Deltaproteobacteria bacterium]TMQ23536.1 MAG: BlaI/MecI/CopY family transcriptional regulator [Deltaproteobacteria bacterium]